MGASLIQLIGVVPGPLLPAQGPNNLPIHIWGVGSPCKAWTHQVRASGHAWKTPHYPTPMAGLGRVGTHRRMPELTPKWDHGYKMLLPRVLALYVGYNPGQSAPGL